MLPMRYGEGLGSSNMMCGVYSDSRKMRGPVLGVKNPMWQATRATAKLEAARELTEAVRAGFESQARAAAAAAADWPLPKFPRVHLRLSGKAFRATTTFFPEIFLEISATTRERKSAQPMRGRRTL